MRIPLWLALLFQPLIAWSMGNPDPMITMFRLDKFEVNTDEHLHWKAKAFVGKDLQKLWIKTEGEAYQSAVESSEWRLLYGQAVSPYWDVMLGLRYINQDKPSRYWLELGWQGLAPYFVESSLSVFINDDSQSRVRATFEKEFMLSQKWGVEPEFKINVNAYNDTNAGVESGLNDIEVGVRLHYQVVRECLPYIGVNWEKTFGAIKEEQTTLVLGVKAWF